MLWVKKFTDSTLTLYREASQIYRVKQMCWFITKNTYVERVQYKLALNLNLSYGMIQHSGSSSEEINWFFRQDCIISKYVITYTLNYLTSRKSISFNSCAVNVPYHEFIQFTGHFNMNTSANLMNLLSQPMQQH